MKNKIINLLFLFSPFVFLYAQPDLSGRVVYPDSVGIDLIRVEVWQNNQQLASTITDSLGYFEMDSIITGVNNIDPVPSSFDIYPNYPSPFDKTTNIIYEVNELEEISITIYNSIGQKITTLTSGYRQKGFYVAQWDGRNSFGDEVAQGIYFARLDNGKETRFIKLLKMNGALNATGTTIPGNFYKGSNVNEDYLVKFIDINIVNRVDYAEITTSLPAQIHQILYEKFTINQYIFYSYEGDTLTVPKNNWTYGTGPVQSFENLSPDWQMWDDSASIYFTTLDPNVNGQEEITLRTIATHNTTDTSTIVVNIFETTTWQGQFVDDMKYKKLLGIIEPEAGLRAEIKVDNQSFFTDNMGYFNIRLTPSANYTVKVQGIEEIGDTTTFQHTFHLAGIDQTDLIFHAAPYWPVLQMNLPLSEGYIFAREANFEPGSGCNISGLKRIHLDTGEHWLARVNPNVGDTMTIEEQNFLASIITDSMNAIMQIPLSIYLASLEDTIPISRRDGLNLWSVDRTGPFGSIGVYDENLDGLLDFNDIQVKGSSPAYVFVILQEGSSGIFGPWPIWSQTFWGKTVLSENGNPEYITLLDKWLLRIIENYEPLDDIDDILGF